MPRPCCCTPPVTPVSCPGCVDGEGPPTLQVTLCRYQLQSISAATGGTILAELDLPAGDYLLDQFLIRDIGSDDGCWWYGPVVGCDDLNTNGNWWRPTAWIPETPNDNEMRVGWARMNGGSSQTPATGSMGLGNSKTFHLFTLPIPKDCFTLNLSTTKTTSGNTGGSDGLGTTFNPHNRYCTTGTASYYREIVTGGTIGVQSL